MSDASKFEIGEMNPWIRVTDALPPHGLVVDTKIDDSDGCRNEQELKYRDGLWWHPNGSMHVYYTPTHWRRAFDVN